MLHFVSQYPYQQTAYILHLFNFRACVYYLKLIDSCFLLSYGRRVIHTVGPKYAVKYHTAAENALSHCYRSCLELLIENGLQRLVAIRCYIHFFLV